ncbi:hypothetical protein L226DRAFT_97966 [Lentinus tigrinus ALCF2SS1-7]|uniref:uncharacterized protein n=1 Tax=Lentinus tigrinus ALCF2SS1-7 TaxID=1328758 RepID=UPI001165F5FC|nr:hypothetical protein L226DRAFT_97966 [Lentinus tigrinus ALCF2SS1-7]
MAPRPGAISSELGLMDGGRGHRARCWTCTLPYPETGWGRVLCWLRAERVLRLCPDSRTEAPGCGKTRGARPGARRDRTTARWWHAGACLEADDAVWRDWRVRTSPGRSSRIARWEEQPGDRARRWQWETVDCEERVQKRARGKTRRVGERERCLDVDVRVLCHRAVAVEDKHSPRCRRFSRSLDQDHQPKLWGHRAEC